MLTEKKQKLDAFEQHVLRTAIEMAEQKMKQKLETDPNLHSRLIDDAIDSMVLAKVEA